MLSGSSGSRGLRSRGLALTTACAVAASGAAAVEACAERDRLPGIGTGLDGGVAAGAGGAGPGLLATSSSSSRPPALDAAGLCGNQLHQTVADAPNLYFVLDASGSMREPAGSGTRYDAVRVAAVDLLRKLGPLVRVGAAIFPGPGGECAAGAEVFPVRAGDPKTGEDGPTTEGFRLATFREPSGGTPTAATLRALHDRVTALDGKTIIVLATDGGPNCNANAVCGAADCGPNIDGDCPPSVNCCGPEVQGGGPSLCVDRAATVSAVADLAADGIDVYVVGVPGSAAYAGVLDEMALAGGAARESSPHYYRVDDFSALAATFGSIAEVIVSCTFQLDDPPEQRDMTNVYVDGQLVPMDPTSGWVWEDDGDVALVGETCSRLKRGEIASVQIVSGCPTELPK